MLHRPICLNSFLRTSLLVSRGLIYSAYLWFKLSGLIFLRLEVMRIPKWWSTCSLFIMRKTWPHLLRSISFTDKIHEMFRISWLSEGSQLIDNKCFASVLVKAGLQLLLQYGWLLQNKKFGILNALWTFHKLFLLLTELIIFFEVFSVSILVPICRKHRQ